jgi:hypothetical protein
MPRTLARPVPFAFLLVLCLAAACGGPRIAWREQPIGAVAYEDAWTAVQRIAEVDGYRVDGSGSDRGRRRFQSSWRARVGTGFGEGGRSTRTRVRAEIERTEDDSAWLVRYCVERAQVLDIAKNMQPEEDDWELVGQDAVMEERIAAKLELRFGRPSAAPGASR